MKEEEAIKRIKILQQDECDCIECRKNKEAYKVLLEAIEKKEKIIKEMANEIYIEHNPHFNTTEEVIEYFEKEEG